MQSSICPSTITGASLDHPTRWAMGSGLKNRMTWVGLSCRPVHCQTAFMFDWPLSGVRVGMWGALLLAGAAFAGGGWKLHSISSPWAGLKLITGVGHSLVNVVSPLAPKTLERIWVPVQLAVPSFLVLVLLVSPVHYFHSQCTPGLTPGGYSCGLGWSVKGLLLPLWEFGQWLGCYCYCVPFCNPSPGGYFAHSEGLLACPVLVRVAMSLAICCPNSAIPSLESVATLALALTLSWISSFLLSAL